jgi:hypothetical protein
LKACTLSATCFSLGAYAYIKRNFGGRYDYILGVVDVFSENADAWTENLPGNGRAGVDQKIKNNSKLTVFSVYLAVICA